jgi:hypothetical protein
MKKAAAKKAKQEKTPRMYTEEQIVEALEVAMRATEQMREDADHKWSKAMAAPLKAAVNIIDQAHGCTLPIQTVKDRFKKLIPMLRDLDTALEVASLQGKARADSHGLLNPLELKSIYHWLLFRVSIKHAATRTEMRFQVRTPCLFSCSPRWLFTFVHHPCAAQAADILAGRGVPHLPSAAWPTRYLDYARRFYGGAGDLGRVISRKPRGQGEQRDAVPPESVARFYWSLEKLLARMPRAVRTVHFAHHGHDCLLTMFCLAAVVLG